jgi:hypothetical protein
VLSELDSVHSGTASAFPTARAIKGEDRGGTIYIDRSTQPNAILKVARHVIRTLSARLQAERLSAKT